MTLLIPRRARLYDAMLTPLYTITRLLVSMINDQRSLIDPAPGFLRDPPRETTPPDSDEPGGQSAARLPGVHRLLSLARRSRRQTPEV